MHQIMSYLNYVCTSYKGMKFHLYTTHPKSTREAGVKAGGHSQHQYGFIL